MSMRRSAYGKSILVAAVAACAGSGVARAQCPAPTVTADGPRYIAITPAAGDDTPVSLRVVTDTQHPECDRFANFDPNLDLAAAGIGRLIPNEIFRPPSEWGTIHVRDSYIAAGLTVIVVAKCDFPDSPELSSPVSVQLPIWGDVVGQFDGAEWTPPNGTVSVQDTLATLDGFANLPTAPARVRIDEEPKMPDYVIDVRDVLATLGGFQGLPQTAECNENGIPDACEIALGIVNDCNNNQIPDACDPDCDGDGIPDDCDSPTDSDGDGVMDCSDLCPDTTTQSICDCPDFGECCFPDSGICFQDYPRDICEDQDGVFECFQSFCRSGCLLGDFDDDGNVDTDDFNEFTNCFTGPDVPRTLECRPGDFEPDGDVDCDDWEGFKTNWTEPSDPPAFPNCP